MERDIDLDMVDDTKEFFTGLHLAIVEHKLRHFSSPFEELGALDRILEEPCLNSEDHRWLYYKRKQLMQLHNKPTSRQKVVGIRRGRLTKELQKHVDYQTQVDAIMDILSKY